MRWRRIRSNNGIRKDRIKKKIKWSARPVYVGGLQIQSPL
jgi:hypothetical protein